jgi:hypothetical protein
MYFDSLGMQIYLAGIFDKCKTVEQVERIREEIEGHLEIAAEEKLEELEGE